MTSPLYDAARHWDAQTAFDFLVDDPRLETREGWDDPAVLLLLARVRPNATLWDALMHRARVRRLSPREIAAYVDRWRADHPDECPPDEAAPPADNHAVATPRTRERWPTLDDAALYGLVGDIVRTIDPYTEADPTATLLSVLVGAGNIVGPVPHARVQHDQHPTRLFVVQVGESSKGRKGTGWSTPRFLFSKSDEAWAASRIKSGLSSGEGLVFNVRDAFWKKEPVKEKGRTVDYQDVLVDDGERDKRLLIVEPEFSSTLTVMAREGNILSAVIRQAWDDGNLSPLTRNNPIQATGAHVSILGHITKQELLARLDNINMANGFGNRFLWALVKRSKLLPKGEAAPDHILNPLIQRLHQVFTFSRTVSLMTRDGDAEALWDAVYGPLSAERPGLLGALLSRAEAQVLRLSVIYALLDCSDTIRTEHLKAALGVWEYCEQSALSIFGDRLGDPMADRILEALRTAGPHGMTDNDIYELFGRHKSTHERASVDHTRCPFHKSCASIWPPGSAGFQPAPKAGGTPALPGNWQ
jgi:hypothetical protein